MRPVLLVAESRDFPKEASSELECLAEVRLEDLDRRGLLEAVGDADILWVRLRTHIDAEVLDAAPRLRVIVTATTGVDHIDVAESARRGIEVLSLKGDRDFLMEVRATAEHTIALMLALLRRIPAAHTHATHGGWDRDAFKGRELDGATVGLVGYGRLGQLVAGYLSCFRARAVASDTGGPPRRPDPAVPIVPLPDLLAVSDIVSIHAGLTPETAGLIGDDEVGSMRPGSFLVNTSRGEIVDEAALLKHLADGHLAGAALDVLADERRPRPAENPLLAYAQSHDNLIVTPHIGGCTVESMTRTELRLARRLVEFLSAQSPSMSAGVDDQ